MPQSVFYNNKTVLVTVSTELYVVNSFFPIGFILCCCFKVILLVRILPLLSTKNMQFLRPSNKLLLYNSFKNLIIFSLAEAHIFLSPLNSRKPWNDLYS